MTLNISREVAVMERMTVDELRGKYAEVYGERTNGRHRRWLVRRIAWRLQAQAEGGLSERALRRAAELANDADLRTTAPPEAQRPYEAASTAPAAPRGKSDPRLPMAGTVLTRNYQGRSVQVTILDKGFEFEGDVYASLSAVARAVTGTQWNGFLFFGINKQGGNV